MLEQAFRKNTFLVLGRAGMDLYADPPGAHVEHATQFTAALGGSAANIAAGIARLGGAASLLGVVSDDAVGCFTLNQLAHHGVGVGHVQAVKGEARNSLAVVETRLENCQSVIYRNNAADFMLTPEQVQRVAFANYGVLIITGTALAAEPSRTATKAAVTAARKAGTVVVMDVDHRPYSWTTLQEASQVLGDVVAQCDMVVANDVEFDVLAGGKAGLEFAASMARRTGKPVVYKMGENGCRSFVGSEQFETPIFRVSALKPTGAGDAFLSAMAMGLARGQSMRQAVSQGAASAAIVVTRVGCAPAMPTREELEAFLGAVQA